MKMYFPVKKEVKHTPPPPSLGSRPRTFFGNQIFQPIVPNKTPCASCGGK